MDSNNRLSMELPIDLYEWLHNLSVLTDEDIESEKEGKVVLTMKGVEELKGGWRMPLLLHRLQALKVILLSNSKELDLERTLYQHFIS